LFEFFDEDFLDCCGVVWLFVHWVSMYCQVLGRNCGSSRGIVRLFLVGNRVCPMLRWAIRVDSVVFHLFCLVISM